MQYIFTDALTFQSALMMTLYLDKFTNFFKIMNVYEALFVKFDDSKLNMQTLVDLPPEKWTENLTFLYVSGILLRHMLQLICNGHAITRLQLADDGCQKLVTEYQCRVATAIYPSASMMNHSCDPNIINRYLNYQIFSFNVSINSCFKKFFLQF